MSMTAKANAIDLYMRGIRDGKPQEALDRNIGAQYKQHSTGVADGKEGFIAFFGPFLERNPKREMQVVRALQDGKKVFVHVYQNLNDGAAEWVTTDFFDSDDEGKIIEHWDVIGEHGINPAGHSNIDGETEISDLDKTADNKATVAEFVQHCLINQNSAKLSDYIDTDQFVSHHPLAAAGLKGYQDALTQSKLKYDAIELMVGEGNFVAMLCRANQNGAALCQCDVFRLAEDRIVEHWANAEPVPPESEWVNSGKF